MGAVVGQVGVGGLLSVVVLFILSGRLVPRATLRDVQTERDTWREAHRVSEEARRLDREQLVELGEFARTADHVLTSLPQPGEVRRGRSGLDQEAPR